MTDVSVDEEQIVGGDYMGRSINRLGHFTTGNESKVLAET